MTVNDIEKGVWTTRSGRMMHLKDMSDSHLEASIKMLEMTIGAGYREAAHRFRNSTRDNALEEDNRRRKELHDIRMSKLSQLKAERRSRDELPV